MKPNIIHHAFDFPGQLSEDSLFILLPYSCAEDFLLFFFE